ncbi:MAG: DNA polymerase III subunit alpha [Bdellovibrionales bacterium]
MSFAHLHVHSMYSLLEASCPPKKLAKLAAEMEMPAIALTDNGNLFGAIEFYHACQREGVKPILGIDAYIAPKSRLVKGEDREAAKMPNRRVVLLAKNYEGYQALCRISSIGFQEGFYYKPRIDYEVLKENAGNLICLSGGPRGDIPFTYLEHGEEAAIEKLHFYKDLYGDDFYLELCRTGVGLWRDLNEFLLKAAKEYGINVVASNDVHYLKSEESLAQEVLICIGTNKTLQDESRFRLGSDQFYLKSPAEMQELFKDIPEALENTLKIADKVDIVFDLEDEDGRRKYHLPLYPTQAGRTMAEQIRVDTLEGLEERRKEAELRDEPIKDEDMQTYLERIDYELGVINSMGFNDYFLIVKDFIQWAKDEDIPVGPGRGSGAGSLVAYCLMITDLDPIPHSLIFERFLNPERISMPDFDIDFCQARRQQVIQYVTEKYGEASVSQIITFGKLQARAAIRDVGRVLGMTFQEVDVVAKLMPDRLGISLKEAIDEESRLRDLMELDPKINTLMELAQKIEGLTRHASIHAAGVIISDKPLVEYAGLYRGSADENVVQYDMGNSESIGLIKFDFLGLKTLTLIYDALKLVELNRNKTIQPHEISMKDPGIYEIMCEGDTAGVFQFEGGGITEFIKKSRPNSFEDITAVTALYRPGPMQFLDEYNGRKHGKIKIQYLFEELEPILSETYGIIVYQEHVQLIAAKIANYSLGEADMLRRAMGKKKPEEMAKQKTRFLAGAKENGFDLKKAEELFEQMAQFAQYGFNKSHAAAYCVISAQTAWIKRYYPIEFFAATLSTEMNNTDKVVQYIKDARDHDIDVRAPHINYSRRKFTVEGETVFFGLGAIKGVGDSAVEAIIEARQSMEKKQFDSLEEFFDNIDLRRINKKVVECLIKAGALDGYDASRAQLLAGYGRYMERADVKRKDREVGQTNLFEMDPNQEEKVSLPDLEDWSKTQKLAFEKEVLGFFLSDHPLNGYEGIMRPFVSHPINSLTQLEKKQKVAVSGLVATYREFVTKKGTRMAFGQIEDLSGGTELIIFPDIYAKVEDLLKEEVPVVVSGTFERDDRGEKIIVEKMDSLEKRIKGSKRMLFQMREEMLDRMDRLKDVFENHRGETTVSFKIDVGEVGRDVYLDLPEFPVEISNALLEDVGKIYGGTEFVSLQ